MPARKWASVTRVKTGATTRPNWLGSDASNHTSHLAAATQPVNPTVTLARHTSNQPTQDLPIFPKHSRGGSDMALVSPSTLGAAPCCLDRRTEPLHEGQPECLSFTADVDFSRLLKTQLPSAIALLQTQLSQSSESFEHRIRFLRMLYTVVQHVTLNFSNAGVLNDPDFFEVLCKIVLDPRSYDVRRKTRTHPEAKLADPESDFEVDYVSLVSNSLNRLLLD